VQNCSDKKRRKKERGVADEKALIGTVRWFDTLKGYGFITEDNTDYFIHASNLLSATSISEGDVVIFSKKLHNGKLSAIKCQLFFDGLNNSSSEGQSELLQKYLFQLQSIDHSVHNQIKSIAQSDKISGIVKTAFLKSTYEKATTEYKYKILFEDHLIDIQKETSESQIELLQKYLLALGRLNYSDYSSILSYYRIKSIAQSDKIDETIKYIFLKLVFKKADTEYLYRMLFVDNLIDIKKESSESQNEFLQIYLSELDKISVSNYSQIKSIAQSITIEQHLREAFLKSVFDKADATYQCLMLLDGLIQLPDESQNEFLQKYLFELDKISVSNYSQIKSIAQSDTIEEHFKDTFLNSVFDKANATYQCIMLLDGLIILPEESQIEILQKYLLVVGNGSYSNYELIKSIAESEKIAEKVKDIILKSAFDSADDEYQFKMLFDGLVILSNETQIELLKKYVSINGNISYSNYDKIKSITQSDKFENIVKDTIVKSAFKTASIEYQYKILFVWIDNSFKRKPN
jgi:cold shock CspA family protein